MKKTIIVLIICGAILFVYAGGFAEEVITQWYEERGTVPYGDDEAVIGGAGIGMPLDRILLIHKDKLYCALKFTKFWRENNGKDKYATYEIYYQDEIGDVLQNIKKDEIGDEDEIGDVLQNIKRTERPLLTYSFNPAITRTIPAFPTVGDISSIAVFLLVSGDITFNSA